MILKVHEKEFEWFNEETGKTMVDGLTIAQIIFAKARPNVKVNVFAQLDRMKKIAPSDFNYDMVRWLAEMEATRVDIELKLKGVYHEDQFILDVFAGCEQVKCKTFKDEMTRMKNRWLLNNPDNWSCSYITTTMLMHYTNMNAPGVDTWAKESAETNQIIALTTRIQELEK